MTAWPANDGDLPIWHLDKGSKAHSTQHLLDVLHQLCLSVLQHAQMLAKGRGTEHIGSVEWHELLDKSETASFKPIGKNKPRVI